MVSEGKLRYRRTLKSSSEQPAASGSAAVGETTTTTKAPASGFSDDEDSKETTSRRQRNGTNHASKQQENNGRHHHHHDAFSITPLIQRTVWTRLDVGPFLLLYTILLAMDYQNGGGENEEQPSLSSSSSSNSNNNLWITTAWAVTLLLHLSVVLLCQWRIRVKAVVGYARCHAAATATVDASNKASSSSSHSWTHCLVESRQAATGSGVGEIEAGIVPVHQENGVCIVSFHDRIFRYSTKQPDLDVSLWEQQQQQDASLSTVSGAGSTGSTHSSEAVQEVAPSFRPLRYPTQQPLSFYTHWKGHANLASVTQATQIYGPNMTVLKLPTFMDLLSEQVVAPFFLFQIVCVILWSLDEYWYYALFTFFALLLFESTLAYNRLQSLQRLHHAGHKGNDRVWVRRGGLAATTRSTNADANTTTPHWMLIPTRELVPGDLVSLSSSNHHQAVPADICIVEGTAVVDEALLTGESIPQLKHALDDTATATTSSSANDATSVCLDLQDTQHKESILFGGTVLLVTTPAKEVSDETAAITPEYGVLGIVLRTGFETAQGNLLRTMAHSSKKVDGVHTWDTFVFIFLLLCCAVGAAAYVLHEGWQDERRNQFRLTLHVVIIITSVVPPELPMELSLAVTNSVADLVKRSQVYCTELFRIPWAGEVTACCFDKTGTLTSDEMRLKGVRVFNAKSTEDDATDEDDRLIIPTESAVPWESLRVMAGCHALALAQTRQGKKKPRISVIGDPLEQAVLNHTGFRLVSNNTVICSEQSICSAQSMTILHRFAFSSKLKRMTVIAAEEGGQGVVWSLTKGAPEVIKTLLLNKSIPSNYDDVAFHHMNRGRRVLAMAYRKAGTIRDLDHIKKAGRDMVEKDLLFAGFLVLDCPLKPDSKTVLSELQNSGHDCVMITGDAVLTAAEVARQVGIIPRTKGKSPPLYRIQQKAESKETSPSSADPLESFEAVLLSSKSEDTATLTLSSSKIKELHSMAKSREASFCISGDVLTQIADRAVRGRLSQDHDIYSSSSPATMDEKHLLLNPASQHVLAQLVPLVSVFARHAPHHKEAVVAALNHSGAHTLMCGDGTNDVGALKRAHVGISIISAPEVEAKQRQVSRTLKEQKRKKKKANAGTRASSSSSSLQETLRQLQQAQEELDHVELGDASVAAPFTSRAVSIACCKAVIQQGRCTLVTMLQIYKILGINCLVNAMVLSRLFLHGVKQGDRQMTILGIVVAGLFFFVTRAEPLPVLSKVRPPASVLCWQAFWSITGQVLIHLGAILLATELALSFVDPYDPSLVPDGPFNPNVLNSCTFLLTCLATVNTFCVNYRGHPFMQNLADNKLLYRSLQACYAVLAICALEIFPPLNDLMQVSALPSGLVEQKSDSITTAAGVLESSWMIELVRMVDFPIFLSGLMVLDTVLAFGWERFVIRTFEE